MFAGIWRMLKETVLAFIEDEALSRGAAIAFYTVTSIAPILLIVAAGGGFKQTLIDAGVGAVVGRAAQGIGISPLILGWLAAVGINPSSVM